ncbi:MAG: hypothetical protein AAF602_10770 [Myxococcota bacterium]
MRAVLALLVVGCTPDGDAVDLARAGETLPDFTLVDVNATSLTAGQPVAVSDQRGRVSAWYFGHST